MNMNGELVQASVFCPEYFIYLRLTGYLFDGIEIHPYVVFGVAQLPCIVFSGLRASLENAAILMTVFVMGSHASMTIVRPSGPVLANVYVVSYRWTYTVC